MDNKEGYYIRYQNGDKTSGTIWVSQQMLDEGYGNIHEHIFRAAKDRAHSDKDNGKVHVISYHDPEDEE